MRCPNFLSNPNNTETLSALPVKTASMRGRDWVKHGKNTATKVCLFQTTQRKQETHSLFQRRCRREAQWPARSSHKSIKVEKTVFFAFCFNLKKPCGRVNSCVIYSSLWTKFLTAQVISACLWTPYGAVIESGMSSWWVGDKRSNLTFRFKIEPEQKDLRSAGFSLRLLLFKSSPMYVHRPRARCGAPLLISTLAICYMGPASDSYCHSWQRIQLLFSFF